MERETNARALAGTVVPTLGVWTWMVSSAYYWHLAVTHDVVLPYLPRCLWLPPGALWDVAPPAHLALMALVPVGAYRMQGATRGARLLRRTALGLATVSIVVALLWGRALVAAVGS